MVKDRKKVRSKVYGIEHHDSHWEVHEWGLDVRQFQIHLSGESITYHADANEDRSEPGVEYQMATRLIKNLRILSDINPERPILIHMHTCGGDWSEGMAIYDAIWACPNPITILSYTHARSMSSIILQAADKRILMPNSYFLFHEGTLGVYGTSKSVHSFAEWDIRIVRPTMMDIYVKALRQKGKFKRQSPGRIMEMLQERMDKKEDVYLTAQEAVEWGFADAIFDRNWHTLIKFPRSFRKVPPPAAVVSIQNDKQS